MEARRQALDADSKARRRWTNPETEYRRHWREWAMQRRDQMQSFEPAGLPGQPDYGFGGYLLRGYAPHGYGDHPWW